eukprot:scaffold24451_cov49-Prasinocladus_malaysianus.AAC.1
MTPAIFVHGSHFFTRIVAALIPQGTGHRRTALCQDETTLLIASAHALNDRRRACMTIQTKR